MEKAVRPRSRLPRDRIESDSSARDEIHPGNQHGENPETVDEPLEDISLIAAPANTLLGQVDAPCLIADSGNEPQ